MESERIGNMTIDQMGRQRDQLTGASANLARTREIAEQAKSVLTEMGRKYLYNIMFLRGLIGLLGFLNLWALVRWLKKE